MTRQDAELSTDGRAAISALSECVLVLGELARMESDGPCWCEHARIASVQAWVHEHSALCLRARRAIESVARAGSKVLASW